MKSGAAAAGLPRVDVLSVEQVGKDVSWTYAPSGETSLLNDRPPLVLDAVVNFADGRALPITVVTVHQRSLNDVESEDAAGTGTRGDRVRQKRQLQAEFLAGLLQDLQADDPERSLVVLGDFNAFEFNDGYADVMGTVTGMPSADATTAVNGDGADLVEPDMINATFMLDPSERYSFVFENNAQSLDHILLNQAALGSRINSWTISHARLNADFPETARNDANSAARLSDHDPSVLMLRLQALQFADMSAVVVAPQATVVAGGTMTWQVEAGNAGPDAASFPGLGFVVDAALPDLAIAAPSGWTCESTTVAGGETSASCTADTLASAEDVLFTVTASAPAAAAGGAITLSAAATSQTEDPDPLNDSDSAAIAVDAQADLGVTLVAAEQIVRGAWGNHSISVHNAGPVAVGDVVVRLSAGVREDLTRVGSGLDCVTESANPFRALCVLEGTIEAGATRHVSFMTGTGGRLTCRCTTSRWTWRRTSRIPTRATTPRAPGSAPSAATKRPDPAGAQRTRRAPAAPVMALPQRATDEHRGPGIMSGSRG